jgi:transcriptional regulator with XRE-family HTH domain
MSPSEIVRLARRNADLTQSELAERLGTTQSAISRLESGRIQPSFETLERVASACGSAVQLLLVRAEAPVPELESDLALTPDQRLRQLLRAVGFERGTD